MTQGYLWDKAAECARAIEAADDPIQREMLTHLQTLWINLANESPLLGDKLDEQIEAISSIHADVMQTATNKVTSTSGLQPLTCKLLTRWIRDGTIWGRPFTLDD
jgi:hypothetical protein